MIKADDWNQISFSDLEGETIVKVDESEEEIIFTTAEGQRIRMYHEQDCCESVTVEDVCGDWEDIINYQIYEADESTNEGSSNWGESETWTFYRLRTNHGGVTIRWYGTSNGYYSESVNLELIK